MFIVPTNEDVAAWSEHRTYAGDRVISYKLPPDPEVRVYPRRVAAIDATSRETQDFVNVGYGYGLPEPRIAELKVEMEVKPVDGGGQMEPSWSAEQFAQFYWYRTYASQPLISPYIPKFETLITSQLPELGETTWYQLTFPDERDHKISGDIFLRPISPTRVLAVSGMYYDYEYMSSQAIERRRALMRKIVAEVRVEPPFGPVKHGPPLSPPP